MKHKTLLISIFLIVFGITSTTVLLFSQKILSPNSNISNQKIIHAVDLTSIGFSPNELFIKMGEYVQFNAKGGKKHIISEGRTNPTEISATDVSHNHDGSSTNIKSPEFDSAEGYLVEFKQKGTFYFQDNNYHNEYILIVIY